AAVFALASISIWRRETALHTGVLVLGTLALVAANAMLLAGLPTEAALPCWLTFFVLTIGGERLELSRLAPVPIAARRAFAIVAVAQIAVALAAVMWFEPALHLLGLLFLVTAVWFARYDIAMRTVRSSGQTRYIAVCLLAGYAWLAIGAALLFFVWGRNSVPEIWDAGLHAILLGFVFSMVFGHAPIILPAVLRIPLPYRPVLYLPLAALHASLLVRVTGDLAGLPALRAGGGAANALALALFIALAAWLALTARRKR
ncbi:MAG: hypothetical protein OEW21_13190, partial [Betaproteobacteria bacterium]|nr:hypothetical protein [Betaproteobacteria bacterium]